MTNTFYDKMKEQMRVIRIVSASTEVKHDLTWGVELPPLEMDMMESINGGDLPVGEDYMAANVSHVSQIRTTVANAAMGRINIDSKIPAMRTLAILMPDINGYLLDEATYQEIRTIILEKNKERTHNLDEFFEEYDALVEENQEIIVKSFKRNQLNMWSNEGGVQKLVFDNEDEFDEALMNVQDQDNAHLVETFFIQLPIDPTNKNSKRKKKSRMKLSSPSVEKTALAIEDELAYKTSYEIYVVTTEAQTDVLVAGIEDIYGGMDYPDITAIKSRFSLKVKVTELPAAAQLEQEALLRSKREVTMDVDAERDALGSLFAAADEVGEASDALKTISTQFKKFYLERLANEIQLICSKSTKLTVKSFWTLMGRDSKNTLYNRPGLVKEMANYNETDWTPFLNRVSKAHGSFITNRPLRKTFVSGESGKDLYDVDYTIHTKSIIDELTLIKNEIRRELNASLSPLAPRKTRRII